MITGDSKSFTSKNTIYSRKSNNTNKGNSPFLVVNNYNPDIQEEEEDYEITEKLLERPITT